MTTAYVPACIRSNPPQHVIDAFQRLKDAHVEFVRAGGLDFDPTMELGNGLVRIWDAERFFAQPASVSPLPAACVPAVPDGADVPSTTPPHTATH